MAKTRDYMDYLDEEIGIAPANSQEEFQAAETIVEIMKDHGLEPTIQEFDSRPVGKLMPSVLMIVLFVGILLAGIAPTPVRIVSLLLTLVAAGLLCAVRMGNDLFENFGTASRSQNVIAVHRASGDKVVKGSRPIVIVAHYDTPHESGLYSGTLARYQATLRKGSFPCSIIVAVAALFQVLGFVPSGLRTLVWIVGLVCALPLLVLALAQIAERFSGCTLGANDNKSSVAAMLSVLDKVAPAEDRVDGRDYPDHEDQPQEEPAAPQVEEVHGVRHGKDVLEALQILPETCEIVYEEPKPLAPVPMDDNEAEDVEGPEDTEQDPYEGDAQEQDAPESDQYEEDDYAPEVPTRPDYLDETAEDEVTDEDAEPWDDEQDWDEEEPADSGADAGEYGEYDEEDDGQTPKTAHKKGGLRKGLASIRRFFSRKKTNGGVTIPRGDDSQDVDFSEFEETDWDDGNDYAAQDDDLRPITREDFSADRLSWDAPEPQETETDEVAADDDALPTTEDEPPVESGHPGSDIDHTGQSDWSVVDEDIVEEPEPEPEEEEPQGIDASVYQQEEDYAGEVYESDSYDIADVEHELDQEQTASRKAPIRMEDTQQEEPEEPHDMGATADLEVTTEEVVEEPADDELSWDDDDAMPEPQPAEESVTRNQERPARNRVDFEEDTDDSGVLPKDTRGLDTISDSYDVYEQSSDQADEPDPIDDPTWGESSFVPPKPKVNVARRAALFDLPDPSEESVDPLADNEDYYEDDEIDEDDQEASAEMADEEEPQDDLDEVDDEYDGRQDHWKGGAAARSDLREDEAEDGVEDDGEDASSPDVVEDVEEQASQEEPVGQEEMQDAILDMGDDYLLAHDVWFVAVGSSDVEHAGMKAFLSNFRQDIRGAFLINLDSIGAGALTVLTREGLNAGRRSDRRLVRLVTRVADDLHVDLQQASYDWDDTDATPAMRSRVRAVTIMGTDGNGLPALSHSQDDVPENVSPEQVASIVRIVTEVIRRA